MKALGFYLVKCGPDGPEARELAEEWNKRWDKVRAQTMTQSREELYLQLRAWTWNLSETLASEFNGLVIPRDLTRCLPRQPHERPRSHWLSWVSAPARCLSRASWLIDDPDSILVILLILFPFVLVAAVLLSYLTGMK
jgi:hypothetical protein